MTNTYELVTVNSLGKELTKTAMHLLEEIDKTVYNRIKIQHSNMMIRVVATGPALLQEDNYRHYIAIEQGICK